MISIENFVQNIADQFDETDSATFAPSTSFKDLDEYSSLIALSIMSMIDDEYDVQLRGDDMRNAGTIEELFNIVKSKM